MLKKQVKGQAAKSAPAIAVPVLDIEDAVEQIRMKAPVRNSKMFVSLKRGEEVKTERVEAQDMVSAGRNLRLFLAEVISQGWSPVIPKALCT